MFRNVQQAGLRHWPVVKIKETETNGQDDWLAVEEPLEIRLAFGPSERRRQQSLAVTMRTPGADFDLAAGFLYSEGIIRGKSDILQMRYVADRLSPEAQENIVLIELHPAVSFDPEQLNRHFYTASSCGICGKASLEMVQTHCPFLLRPEWPRVPASVICRLPEVLLQGQSVFAQTGGIHAAALFSPRGELSLVREDVGRHNALDKLLGAAMKQFTLPLSETLLLVSGRASFELVQKALMAGIPMLAAVGAPSSLAVELADAYNMTLIGFLRNGQFNVYCGASRIA